MVFPIFDTATQDIYHALNASIEREFVECRERSLAFTKLEECFMWLQKATRRYPERNMSISLGKTNISGPDLAEATHELSTRPTHLEG